MSRIRKQWPIDHQIRQLELDIRLPRKFVVNLMRHRGVVYLVAGSVAIIASMLTHPHLVIVLAPVATGLYAIGLVMLQQQRKRGGVANPLDLISLVQGRSTLRQKQPKKYNSRGSRYS